MHRMSINRCVCVCTTAYCPYLPDFEHNPQGSGQLVTREVSFHFVGTALMNSVGSQ